MRVSWWAALQELRLPPDHRPQTGLPGRSRLPAIRKEETNTKINKIKALAVQRKRATLLDEVDKKSRVKRQWISVGTAMYPILGMPIISAENLPTLLQLSDSQTEAMKISEEPLTADLDMGDFRDGPEIVHEEGLSIILHGRETLIIRTQSGVLLLEAALLSPIWRSTMLMQVRRTAGGIPYICAYDGLFLAGILYPFSPRALQAGDVAALACVAFAAQEDPEPEERDED